MATKKAFPLPFLYKLLISLIVLGAMFWTALIFGAVDTTIRDVWIAITSHTKEERALMIWELRIPREIAAAFVGAALSISGAVMQGMTRNPLADPGLLGLTAGANAALAITLAFFPAANYLLITMACLVGAAIGSMVVFGIGAVKKGGFSPLRIVLAGSAVSMFLYAVAEGISLYFKISKDVSMWTAGGMSGTTWKQLQMITPFLVVGAVIAFFFARQLTVLSLNEEVAIGLGQKTIQVKTMLFIAVLLLAGASVALAGNMTFVGLMIPHIVRAIVGTDYRFILPMSATVGGAFMLLADTLGRTINAPYETPVAAIVAVMGLPFFLFIVHKKGGTFS
ncbi:FecCD family ABC transporter permease [Anoxybacillus sp. J5B_2022]|uniref:FecCD family ABC transporter permease n=1 Tax=Anoxybacillus sp. J5B_2022 TaxID=3003246 RepID=UPI0022860DA9|nr:iron ABC transporter permease [Anoxybacillus sp. J5B_2022]MCZ0756939.1 iron ABC transporter permease [Anoxybacillus sp. J5B_2022]